MNIVMKISTGRVLLVHLDRNTLKNERKVIIVILLDVFCVIVTNLLYVVEVYVKYRIAGQKGTPRIIWSYLSWQNLCLDKLAQDPVQLNLTLAQCWGIHCFSGEIIPLADCSHY